MRVVRRSLRESVRRVREFARFVVTDRLQRLEVEAVVSGSAVQQDPGEPRPVPDSLYQMLPPATASRDSPAARTSRLCAAAICESTVCADLPVQAASRERRMSLRMRAPEDPVMRVRAI